MIDVSNLIQKHLYITKDEEQDVHTSQESVKELLRDFGTQVLKEAADKATYTTGEYAGTYIRINKQSITSIINDINFD